MSTYTPDRWVVITISKGDVSIDKVLAGWVGGWAKADSWQLNSGIVKVDEYDDHYVFHGHSGSEYVCYKNNYGCSMLMTDVITRIKMNEGTTVEICDVYQQH